MATPGPSTSTSASAGLAQPSKKWLCKAPASYNKLPGTLYLSATNLVWKQDGVPQPGVNVRVERAWSLFNSKEGSLPLRMKVTFTDNEKGYNFAFTAPAPDDASAQRAAFVRELTAIINRNKSRAASSDPGTPGTPGSGTRAGTPVAGPSASAIASGSGAGIGQENLLRRSVLLKHAELATLHKDLVISGQLSEGEFWQGREWMLDAERAALGQRRGRASQLVDPKPTTVEGGDIRIVITPQLVHDIFEEFPVVARAYTENVPNEMNEATFWSRYFQSKLFNQNRASTRSAAPQHVVKDDPVFDRYLEPEDDQIEPRFIISEHVDRLLDLAATEEDHEETGNEVDVTMQPGKERGILPLIRRFNVHSERLLQQALGEQPNKKRRLEDGRTEERFDPENYYSQIEIPDLIDHHASSGILLHMQDRSSYFSGSTAAGDTHAPSSLPHRTAAESTALLHAFRSQTTVYLPSLHALKPPRKATDAAFGSMTRAVGAAHVHFAAHKLAPIPAAFFRQMTTCQTAANEFLRQFWGAVLPQPVLEGGGRTLGGGGGMMTALQRSQKATKMAGYLARTGEKVDALVSAAGKEGVDPARVRAAFVPLMSAVEKALNLYKERAKK